MLLKMSLVGMSVTIESMRILTRFSESSKVRYNTLSPANAQLTPRLAMNKLLPEPDPPAKMLSSPLLNPPNNFLSSPGQPVLTCPFLSLIASSLDLGSPQ